MNKRKLAAPSAAELELQKRVRDLIASRGGGHNEKEVADIL